MQKLASSLLNSEVSVHLSNDIGIQWFEIHTDVDGAILFQANDHPCTPRSGYIYLRDESFCFHLVKFCFYPVDVGVMGCDGA